MRSYILAFAALAPIGFAGAAFAGEAKSTAPTPMTDAEMDAVTAAGGAIIERFPDGNMRVDPADDYNVIGVNPGVKVENDHRNVINGVTPTVGTAHNLPHDWRSLCTGSLNC